jgi:TRAP-type C4-dicarboxylate transport system permease small subunit
LADRLERLGTALESAALVILLGALMVLAVAQIVAREVFDTGMIWADELIKFFVLWIALIAAVAASRSDRHLRIDALSQFVADRYARYPRIIVDAFAAFMCGLLAWHSWRYLQLTIEFGDTVLGDLPAWTAYLLLPLSLTLMSYRFLLLSISGLLRAIRGEDSGQAAS